MYTIPQILIPEETIREFIFLNVRWEYESYDYRAARAELLEEELKRGHLPPMFNTKHAYGNDIPPEIKTNHVVWRTGKIRGVDFAPSGVMNKFRIGNKFAKTFYIHDFGVRVKPRIYKWDDKYNLISRGLAVEETI